MGTSVTLSANTPRLWTFPVQPEIEENVSITEKFAEIVGLSLATDSGGEIGY